MSRTERRLGRDSRGVDVGESAHANTRNYMPIGAG
jgi:hypothetical protein